MSSYEGADQMTDLQERWTLEKCIKKMERNVEKGNALQKILKAEMLAAKPAKTEQEPKHERY